uniref:Uncharacterized protein n=1 Tax=Rhizophora mucronata TaxID=61149 RepID=A0A2P2JDA6_RHIMU
MAIINQLSEGAGLTGLANPKTQSDAMPDSSRRMQHVIPPLRVSRRLHLLMLSYSFIHCFSSTAKLDRGDRDMKGRRRLVATQKYPRGENEKVS